MQIRENKKEKKAKAVAHAVLYAVQDRNHYLASPSGLVAATVLDLRCGAEAVAAARHRGGRTSFPVAP